MIILKATLRQAGGAERAFKNKSRVAVPITLQYGQVTIYDGQRKSVRSLWLTNELLVKLETDKMGKWESAIETFVGLFLDNT